MTLNNTGTENPTHYMASESADFSESSWQTYTATPSFMLSAGNSTKTVYFKLMNGVGESSVASDTITLNDNVSATEATILLPGDVPLTMVWCPAGTFLMGATDSEQDSWISEKPQHQVTLTQGFWMGKYEVTQAQWQAVMGSNPSYFTGDLSRPVECVTWDDAQLFVTTLKTLTGKTFQLPTEAEWEYACRAGTTTRCYWGDDASYTQIGDYAWNYNNSAEMTHPVGQKRPNAWGLYDMNGNVWELCRDWFDIYMPDAVTDPIGPTDGYQRVQRGGAWVHNNPMCRSSWRDEYFFLEDPIYNFFGIRLVSSDLMDLSITSFNLNKGDDSTQSPTVTLDNVCTNGATHYMVSESASFSDASWQTYATDPPFTLAPGNDAKTVYFKVKNGTGESPVVCDTITLNENIIEETILLPGNVPMVMVWVPAGTFMMGSSAGDQDSEAAEFPRHQVTLQGFWMGKYAVTKGQWISIMGTTPWTGKSYVLEDPDSPAVYISWNNAQPFITALNSYTGLSFRFPSEAQREYATRAGTTTRFYWGDDPDYAQVNIYAWNIFNAWYANEQYAHVVGLKPPNRFGLYDMSGNVYEWCQDWLHANYTGAPTDGSAWEDPVGTSRVYRGGGWDYRGNYGRSAYRGYREPSFPSSHIGFRLIR